MKYKHKSVGKSYAPAAYTCKTRAVYLFTGLLIVANFTLRPDNAHSQEWMAYHGGAQSNSLITDIEAHYTCLDLSGFGSRLLVMVPSRISLAVGRTAAIVISDITTPLLRSMVDLDGDISFSMRTKEVEHFSLLAPQIQAIGFEASSTMHRNLLTALKNGSTMSIGIPAHNSDGFILNIWSLRGSTAAIGSACG